MRYNKYAETLTNSKDMKVALCYWGIARSTDETIESIERHILKPLLDANVDVTVFLHTYTSMIPYTNPRSNEWGI